MSMIRLSCSELRREAALPRDSRRYMLRPLATVLWHMATDTPRRQRPTVRPAAGRILHQVEAKQSKQKEEEEEEEKTLREPGTRDGQKRRNGGYLLTCYSS